MNIEQIKAAVQEIDSLDDEEAHRKEDQLYIDFVKAVAAWGFPDAIMAQEVLKTRDIGFSRYYI